MEDREKMRDRTADFTCQIINIPTVSGEPGQSFFNGYRETHETIKKIANDD